MAISEDRLKTAEITKKTVSNFQSKVDTSFESIESKFNAVVDSVEGTINNTITGFQSKIDGVTGYLNDAIPKNLSFNTKSLGFFENILCGNFPSMNLRLPNFKLDGFKKLDFAFNMTVCGKSKSMNPIDAALSVVKGIQSPKSLFNSLIGDGIDGLVNNAVGKLMNSLNISPVPNCVLNNSRWGIKGYGDTLGGSLYGKNSIFGLAGLDGCAGEFLRTGKGSNELERLALGTVLDRVSGGGSDIGFDTLFRLMSRDPYTTAWGLSSMFNKEDNPNVYTQMDMFNSAYSSNNADDFNMLLNSTKGVDDRTLSLKEGVSGQELLGLQTDSKVILNNMKQNKTEWTDPDQKMQEIFTSLNILDPTWKSDEEGNLSMHKFKGNETMKDLSQDFITNDTSYKNPTTLLTGKYVTDLDLAEQIVVINHFDPMEEFKA